jgi:hypothetical protein
MLDFLQKYIPLFLSVIAMVITFLNYLHNKNSLTANLVPKNRLVWIEALRGVLYEFIECYLTPFTTREQLMVKYVRICMYLNCNNTEHKPLIEALKTCIDVGFEQRDYDIELIIKASQYVLNRSWKRFKIESKMSLRMEKRRDKQMKK